jgi:hypothetical protein
MLPSVKSAAEDALAPGVVGPIEALEQDLQVRRAAPREAEHLALNAPVEALHHPVRARRRGPHLAMLDPKLPARGLEALGREAEAAVREHMTDPEPEGPEGLFQKEYATVNEWLHCVAAKLVGSESDDGYEGG